MSLFAILSILVGIVIMLHAGVVKYGFPELVAHKGVPMDIDFYVLSNEDIGFNANLVAGTNDVHAFALPYPSSIDLFDETIMVHMIEFVMQTSRGLLTATAFQRLTCFLSMLDKEFAPDWNAVATDVEDENLKAQFARNIEFGMANINITAVASIEGSARSMDAIQDAIYYPPIPLDLVTPLYIQMVNQSVSVVLATNVPTDSDYSFFERTQLVVWFTRRRLSASEKSARNMQIRFQRLDS